MPYVAITYDIKRGYEEEVVEVFQNFVRPNRSVLQDEGGAVSRILATAVFIRDGLLVRFIEYEGDLDTVVRFIATQPGVREVERKLAPYLNTARDTDTVEGFVRTFAASRLRCVSQFGVPRQASSG